MNAYRSPTRYERLDGESERGHIELDWFSQEHHPESSNESYVVSSNQWHWPNLATAKRYCVIRWFFRLKHWHRRNWAAWKFGATLNVAIASLVLTLNIAIPSWAAGKYGIHEGYLFRGSCEKTENVALITHAVINILGTLLLSSSNYTMQILSAPTREDIDSAHQQGKTLSIGIPSISNLPFLGYQRTLLWGLLALSSIPLHLIYNSVVFSATGAIWYMAAVVDPSFAEGSPYDLSSVNDIYSATSRPLFQTGLQNSSVNPVGLDSYITHFSDTNADRIALEALQKKAQHGQLITMSTAECLKAYFTTQPTMYRNVLAVSDNAISNSSVIWIDHSTALGPGLPNFDRDMVGNEAPSPGTWICKYVSPSGVLSMLNYTLQDCGEMGYPQKSSNWSLGFYAKHYNVTAVNPGNTRWRIGSHPISRCLVEQTASPCSLKYNKRLLLIVIAANVVKVLGMFATLLQYKHPSLVTVGDGIASFLEHPDSTTKGFCLATDEDFSSVPWDPKPKEFLGNSSTSNRSSGASKLQWAATLSLFAATMITTATLFTKIYYPANFHWSFSSHARPDTVTLGQGLDVGSLIILANIPQLFLSFNYILLNRLVTCMAASREWSLFAHQRKGLRTSLPTGAQRSTYWLQLPFKFSVPLMVVSAGLHYFASQSLYFGSVRYYAHYDDQNGDPVVLQDYTGLGYSQEPAYLLMVTLIVAVAAVVTWGRLQNRCGIPPSRFCSAAIAAACHPSAVEEHVHLKPVRWGEVTGDGDVGRVGHCSFSSLKVTMPLEGKQYM